MAGSGSLIRVSDFPKAYTLTGTIGTGWSGSAAPFTQTVTMNGLLSSDKVVIDMVPSGDYNTAKNQIKNYGYIYRIVTNNNSITCYATEKTTVNIPIQLMIIRGQTT